VAELSELAPSDALPTPDVIPELGESIAIDVNHEYAWVKENNPRLKDRFCEESSYSPAKARGGFF